MAIEISVPKLGLTMEEAVLVSWKAAAGAKVQKEQIVLVLETDKVTFEMPAPGDGLLHPIVAPGSRIKVSQVVGYLAADQSELSGLAGRTPAAAAAGAAPEAEAAAVAAAGGAAAPAAVAVLEKGAAVGGRPKASPAARAMAKVHGLDLNLIAGSGPGGRVVRADVLAALEKGIPAAPAAVPAPAPAAAEALPGVAADLQLSATREIPIAGVRKVIFKNMHLSLATQAQLTLQTEACASALMRLRARFNGGAKVSYNAVLVKVIAQALKQHPLINASVEGDVIKVWRQVHVGVAMDAGRGLVVPKVRHADIKSIREIAADLDRLAQAGQAGTLGPDDLVVGTFTLTNLGAWGIDGFTPIVNHPESAILGVGRITDKPVARDGCVVVEPRISLSLSFDHRIIDGAPGAAFLKTIREMIEDPELML